MATNRPVPLCVCVCDRVFDSQPRVQLREKLWVRRWFAKCAATPAAGNTTASTPATAAVASSNEASGGGSFTGEVQRYSSPHCQVSVFQFELFFFFFYLKSTDAKIHNVPICKCSALWVMEVNSKCTSDIIFSFFIQHISRDLTPVISNKSHKLWQKIQICVFSYNNKIICWLKGIILDPNVKEKM